MTRKAFLEKYFLRFAASLALLGLLVYVIYHVIGSSTDGLMTTPARQITDLQILGGEGYLFREEEVLSVDHPGVVNDLAESGSKVGKNVTLSEVWYGYREDEREELQARLDRINRMLAVLEESTVPSDTTLSKAESFRTEATEDYLAIRQAIVTGEWAGLLEHEDSMLAMLNRYVTLTSDQDAVSVLSESLEAEKTALLRGEFSTLQNTRSSGYFYDRTMVDGYESLFTAAALEALTPERFAELTVAEPVAESAFSVGKMVYGDEWSLAVGFSADAAAFFSAGERYSIVFPENRDRELTMLCEKLLLGEETCVVVFSSYEVPSDFLYLRAQSIEITVGSTSGYYVPDAAMHTDEAGNEGVYVFFESRLSFRRVEVLYRGDGYCVVAERGDRGEDYLGLNDLMVTSGANLYHGRVYQ